MIPENLWSHPDVVSSLITGAATLFAAVIVGVFGAFIGAWFSRHRDSQDRESQWRSHAVELTKLDLERKLKTRDPNDRKPLRPSILDFLANYRDLQELGELSPKDLYLRIQKSRVSHQGESSADAVNGQQQGSASREGKPDG
jgi:hypothetical protein